MKMTNEQIEQNVEVYRAWLYGAEIQYFEEEKWRDNFLPVGSIIFGAPVRLKPQPKLRAWKPEEVPHGCIIRKKLDRGTWVMITACLYGSPKLGLLLSSVGGYPSPFEDFKTAFNDYGKTWLPCGVLES
jgi:hypothetical protein